MPSALVSTEIVIGILLVAVALVLVVTYARRRYIAHGQPLTVCAVRPESVKRWRLGLIKFGDNALEWYALGGVSVRPRHRWARQSLLLETPGPLPPGESIPVIPAAQRVPCTSGSERFDLALAHADYTALRSWQEAAPPGYNVNVA
ncbi:MAG: DUF2550 domain-containing protein [Intrasporangium sp.]|uniref:DUF2550 domain-containing protein n=1 Tax=Intrasporangium sp. TaxID=1925024 RepID=UPI00264835A6|nr:DUF2550 domain-containing protein [Intrasporangium sp.]MDN5797975.1 DUF2550 domain-containing protein [Intrasporangium sp.]